MVPITMGLRHAPSACLLNSRPATPTGIDADRQQPEQHVIALPVARRADAHSESLPMICTQSREK
jgi:hypothetical protein